ncbi:hypothetical protein G7Y89_g3316 [Cudoniella acicularis]|uniref:FAD-binding domain-containing protein n=1 Tax=Cudoniella acicularis TaxID=354080 RepID=A0A8H4RRM2_9HELO|nr:hypothetical protein G7Y89_g3316 [Cudoniella acicularis]
MVLPTSLKPCHIAIIGGGIGGCILGVALSKYPHITFTIYESRPTIGEIGAGLGFGANSHRAMSLISPAIWESYKTRASFNGWAEKENVWFDFTVGEKENCAEFNKKLVDVDQSKGKVVCKFADRTEAEADVVVGCNGIKSACRSLVFDNQKELVALVFTQKVAYRGLMPMEVAEEVLGKDKANNRQMYLGHGGHVLTFPVGKVPTFHKERLCLLGDAAHATSPHYGQESGMAIEDAYVLSNLFSACSSSSDILRVPNAYDFVRVPRALRVTELSREQGKILDMGGDTAGDDLEKIAEELNTTVRWMWNEDLEAYLALAMENFKERRS